MYCSGWVKRGPVGVIVDTMNDAFATGATISDDVKNGTLTADNTKNRDELVERLKQNGYTHKPPICVEINLFKLKLFDFAGKTVVSFSDWERLDTIEKDLGELCGKSRQKITDIDQMLTFMTPIS